MITKFKKILIYVLLVFNIILTTAFLVNSTILKNEFDTWISLGERFTRKNGQELCERIQYIEQLVLNNHRDCNYVIPTDKK